MKTPDNTLPIKVQGPYVTIRTLMLVKGHLFEVKGNSFKFVTQRPEFKFRLYYLLSVKPWPSHLTSRGYLSSPPKCVCELGSVQGSLPSRHTQHLCRNGDWGEVGGSTPRTRYPFPKPSVHPMAVRPSYTQPGSFTSGAEFRAECYKPSVSTTPKMFLGSWFLL